MSEKGRQTWVLQNLTDRGVGLGWQGVGPLYPCQRGRAIWPWPGWGRPSTTASSTASRTAAGTSRPLGGEPAGAGRGGALRAGAVGERRRQPRTARSTADPASGAGVGLRTSDNKRGEATVAPYLLNKGTVPPTFGRRACCHSPTPTSNEGPAQPLVSPKMSEVETQVRVGENVQLPGQLPISKLCTKLFLRTNTRWGGGGGVKTHPPPWGDPLGGRLSRPTFVGNSNLAAPKKYFSPKI